MTCGLESEFANPETLIYVHYTTYSDSVPFIDEVDVWRSSIMKFFFSSLRAGTTADTNLALN